MKKKTFFSLFACIAIVFSLGVLFSLKTVNIHTCSAVAAVETLSTDEDDIAVTEIESSEEENYTFLGRVWEWIKDNKTELVSGVGSVLLFVLYVINYIRSKKSLSSISSTVLTTSSSQSDVVSVVNKLIEGYNKLEEITEKYANTEDEKYKTFATTIVQTKAILEILTTVYANSKNIPQGVKDLVNLKYADALKLIGDEDKLKEVVETVEAEEQNAEEQSSTDTEV